MTSSWFFLSTLTYDARSATRQIVNKFAQDIEVCRLTLYESWDGKTDLETLKRSLRIYGGPVGITKSRRVRDATHGANTIEPPCEMR